MAGRRILVVASEASVREAIALAMADLGAEVVAAAGGDHALALLRSGPRPSVILIDRLPGVSGEELLREMRADPRFEQVPVITMSGGTAVSEDGGVLARLHKPIDLADLREIVLSLFEIAA